VDVALNYWAEFTSQQPIWHHTRMSKFNAELILFVFPG